MAAGRAQGEACCDGVNRGPTYANGTVFFNSLDAHTLAVDAETGKVKWKTRVGDYSGGETMTMAPFVVGDNRDRRQFGRRVRRARLDRRPRPPTARSLARLFHRAGQGRADRPSDLQALLSAISRQGPGLSVGRAMPGRSAAAAVWGWISYDPEQNLIFHGTSNPSPWNHASAPATTSGPTAFSRASPRPARRTGSISTARTICGIIPASTRTSSSTCRGGERSRKVIIRPERNGYIYVLDRTTGEVLAADPYVANTVSDGVDLKTGRLRHRRR
jgi:hypothetical protein